MKHTPGPWTLAQYAKGFDLPIPVKEHKTIAVFSIGPNHGDIAYMQHGLWKDDQAIANARLIAAAPELLEALKMAVRQNEHEMLMTGEELREARSAIAKATGTQE